MTLENLIGKGLESEPVDIAEITRLLEKITTKIADARVEAISCETRFDITYEALLQIGLTALRCHGLRPNSRGGHHVMALQTLPLTIGYPKGNVRLLEEFRKQRAAGLYDGSFTPSEQELTELINEVCALQEQLVHWIRSHERTLNR